MEQNCSLVYLDNQKSLYYLSLYIRVTMLSPFITVVEIRGPKVGFNNFNRVKEDNELESYLESFTALEAKN